MNQQYNILLIINFLRMKKNKIMKDYWRVCWMALLLVALFFGSCSDDNDSNGDTMTATEIQTMQHLIRIFRVK